MKRVFFAAAWCGLAAYCMLLTTLGPSGLFALRKAKTAEYAVRDNLEKLARLNGKYREEWEIFRNEWSASALEARSLGYISDTEIAVRLQHGESSVYTPHIGAYVLFEPETPMSESTIKKLAFAFMLAMILIGVLVHLFSVPGKGRKKRSA